MPVTRSLPSSSRALHLGQGLALLAVLFAASSAHANAWQSARPADPEWTVAFSPYHLAYPIALVTVDYDLHAAGSITFEVGAGSFRRADALVLGLRLPIYFFGDYRFAVWLAPFFRAVAMQYRDERSVAAPKGGSVHSAIQIAFADIEHARANGSSAIVPGLLAGARYIGPFGITLQGGAGLGVAVPVARTSLGPDPDARSTSAELLPMLQIELGYAF